MSEFLELEDEEDIPCCPETPEPFPDFSIRSLDDLGPCTLTIPGKELVKLIYTKDHLKDPTAIRVAVANAFCKYFKITTIELTYPPEL